MSRRLTVLSIAYPFAPVGPDAVGGAEQILSAIDYALHDAGHCSLVVACEGSTIAGTLLPIPRFAGGVIEQADRDRAHDTIRHATDAAMRRYDIDLIHLHGIDFPAYLPPLGRPVLITLHLPPGWYPQDALRLHRPETWLHCVSASQDAALRAIAGHPGILPAIPNGIAVDRFMGDLRGRRGFALTLGRICPEKGQHLALEAAKLANVPLLLAGEVFPYAVHKAYFEAEVAPGLGAGGHWIGPVGFTRKRRLLSAARCVLIPSLAPETSSLVAMEAIASGTPVIAFNSGALPDTVQHGVTGFIVNDAAEMATAIRRSGEIDPSTCRRIARERFSAEAMTKAYLARYRTLAAAMAPA